MAPHLKERIPSSKDRGVTVCNMCIQLSLVRQLDGERSWGRGGDGYELDPRPLGSDDEGRIHWYRSEVSEIDFNGGDYRYWHRNESSEHRRRRTPSLMLNSG